MCVCVCIYICMNVCIMYVWKYVSVEVSVDVSMHICIYVRMYCLSGTLGDISTTSTLFLSINKKVNMFNDKYILVRKRNRTT